ncbi:hypothetical protein F511_37454 [Dorcoceras hygrometricum]|uniref:Uncharacterized protein n=1 Tax=Dorcoceras hygrometricum TaxID=472368 RepID=A0A2Z7AAH2_9LAMI|nr:hypothetical protein F511_37454 [Dorcoceras hygrometricum]
MSPRRKEQSDKSNEIDSMPELEELLTSDEDQQEISVQGMVDRIEGHSHGHTVAKQPVEPHKYVPEKNVIDMEEASRVMVEGTLAHVKAVVSHATQSTNYGSFQSKEPGQGVGSSRAGEARRSIPTPRVMKRGTHPLIEEKKLVSRETQRSLEETGKPKTPSTSAANKINPVNQPGLYEEGVGMGFPAGTRASILEMELIKLGGTILSPPA